MPNFGMLIWRYEPMKKSLRREKKKETERVWGTLQEDLETFLSILMSWAKNNTQKHQCFGGQRTPRTYMSLFALLIWGGGGAVGEEVEEKEGAYFVI